MGVLRVLTSSDELRVCCIQDKLLLLLYDKFWTESSVTCLQSEGSSLQRPTIYISSYDPGPVPGYTQWRGGRGESE